MIYWQVLGIGLVLIVMIILLSRFLTRFKTKKGIFLSVFFVIILFSVGFSLRLSGEQEFIDFGFYLTEISFLFTYVIFTVALLLGQIKYWKVS